MCSLQLKGGHEETVMDTTRSVFQLFGDCRLVHNWLDSKPVWSIWFPLKVLDAVLRGFSQVVFANNTISGICVVIGLAVADGLVCAAGLLAATLATLTALMLKQDWDLTGNGLMTYNGVLVGTVTASLCPPIVESTGGPVYVSWCFIAFGGIMSALVTSGLRSLCKGASLPAMTVPFNLIDLLVFICLPSTLTHLNDGIRNSSLIQEQSGDLSHFHNVTGELSVDWLLVFRGSLVSMGQVWAVESVTCSAIMYGGIFLFSPLLSVSLFSGSLVASLCALGLTEDYTAIYSGLWGYNSALTAGAIAVTFYIPTLLSAFNAFMAVVFTAASQRAFSLVLAPASLPVLTIPFVTTSAIFLAVASGSGLMEGLIKAPDGRPPEYQRKRHCQLSSQTPSETTYGEELHQ